MSLLKANSIQVGQSATATNNFVWYQPALPDGTIRLGNGNSGSVTDILTITSTGSATFKGSVVAAGTATSAADLKLYEDTDNGTNYVSLKAPAAISANVTWTLPTADGTSNQALITNGSGTLSWSAIGASLTDDTTTDSSFYIGLSSSTSGTWTSAKVSSTKLYFNPNTGTLNATIFNSLSDASQKKNVVKIENATQTLNKIDGVEFDWIENSKHSAGVIAQQLEKILPFLVETNTDGIKSVNYSGLIAYLIASNGELSSRINVLENKMKKIGV